MHLHLHVLTAKPLKWKLQILSKHFYLVCICESVNGWHSADHQTLTLNWPWGHGAQCPCHGGIWRHPESAEWVYWRPSLCRSPSLWYDRRVPRQRPCKENNNLWKMHINNFFKQKSQTFASFSFLNVRICCFSSSIMTVNEEALGFGLLVRRKKLFQDVTLGSRKLWAFFTFFLIILFLLHFTD